MKFLVIPIIAFSVFFSASCSKKNDAEFSGEVVIDEGYKPASGDEIVIDERSFAQSDAGDSGQRSGHQERTRIIADNSKITTMFDGYGNKTETRFFDNNPLLLSITVRTSVSGEKQVSVYAQNGMVNRLPENMFDRVLSSSANDLAAAAGIFEGRREPTIVQSNQPPLQPMPSYKFPVQTPLPQTQPLPAETTEAEPPAVETPKPPIESQTLPKQKTEKIASKNPSGEQD